MPPTEICPNLTKIYSVSGCCHFSSQRKWWIRAKAGRAVSLPWSMVTWIIRFENRSSLLLMTLDLCACFGFVLSGSHKGFHCSPEVPIHMRVAAPAQYKMPSTILRSTLQLWLRRRIAQMELLSSPTVLLIVGFLSIGILSPTHCAARVQVSHLTSLCFPPWWANRNTSCRIWASSSSAEILAFGVRPLEKTC